MTEHIQSQSYTPVRGQLEHITYRRTKRQEHTTKDSTGLFRCITLTSTLISGVTAHNHN